MNALKQQKDFKRKKKGYSRKKYARTLTPLNFVGEK